MTVGEVLKRRYPVLIAPCGPHYISLTTLPSQIQLSYSATTDSSDSTHQTNKNNLTNCPLSASMHTKLLCFKTKMCHFNLHNKCARGQFCAFAHTNKELQHKPNFVKTKLCSKWKLGQCSYNSGTCLYAHGLDDLRNFRGCAQEMSEKTASTDTTTASGAPGCYYVALDDGLPVMVGSNTYIDSQESQKDMQFSQNKAVYLSDTSEYATNTSPNSEPQLDRGHAKLFFQEDSVSPQNVVDYSTFICSDNHSQLPSSLALQISSMYPDVTPYPFYNVPQQVVYNPEQLNLAKHFSPAEIVNPANTAVLMPITYVSSQDLIRAMPNYYEE